MPGPCPPGLSSASSPGAWDLGGGSGGGTQRGTKGLKPACSPGPLRGLSRARCCPQLAKAPKRSPTLAFLGQEGPPLIRWGPNRQREARKGPPFRGWAAAHPGDWRTVWLAAWKKDADRACLGGLHPTSWWGTKWRLLRKKKGMSGGCESCPELGLLFPSRRRVLRAQDVRSARVSLVFGRAEEDVRFLSPPFPLLSL